MFDFGFGKFETNIRIKKKSEIEHPKSEIKRCQN